MTTGAWASRLRVAAVLILIGDLTVSAAGRLWIVWRFHRTGFGNGSKSVLLANENRYAAFRASLPPYTVVGYLSDRPYPVLRASLDENPVALPPLQNARFAIAPLILAQNSEQRYVLGDFQNIDAARPRIAAGGWQVIRNFGQGVFLLARPGGR